MSEALEQRAEIAKLARLLRREPEQLDYLSQVSSAGLRELREQATERLFDADASTLSRLAMASRVLPIGLLATLVERVFGPVLAAHMAGLIEPDRAVALAARLPIELVADIASELDPRRAHEVIVRIEPERVAAITQQLVARGDYVTMGRFVSHLNPPAVRAAMKTLDDRALLETAFVLERKETFSELIDLLGDAELERALRTAATEGLWPETLDLLRALTDDQRERVSELAASSDDATLDSLVRAAHEASLWELVLPLSALMKPASLERFVSLRSLQDAGVLESIVDAAAGHEELWDDLLGLVARLPGPCQARVAARAGQLGALGRLGELGLARSARPAA